MPTRKELGEQIRELIRSVSQADPASRSLAAFEQALNAQISDFAVLANLMSSYVQETQQQITALKSENMELREELGKLTVIRSPD